MWTVNSEILKITLSYDIELPIEYKYIVRVCRVYRESNIIFTEWFQQVLVNIVLFKRYHGH